MNRIELDVLQDTVARLERHGMEYMLTGSMALNVYAQPRMTRDTDIVLVFHLKDAARLKDIFGEDYYYSEEAALHQISFNALHLASMVKVDFIVRKREEYRMQEFARRVRHKLGEGEMWVVSKEDIIISKLDWARNSMSERQLADVGNLLATGCDLGYVRECAAKLNLIAMLTRVSP